MVDGILTIEVYNTWRKVASIPSHLNAIGFSIICKDSTWMLVKARRDTEKTTGHAHIYIAYFSHTVQQWLFLHY